MTIIRRLQEIAETHGWQMSHVALAWINRQASSSTIGFSSVARIEDAIVVRSRALIEGGGEMDGGAVPAQEDIWSHMILQIRTNST